MKKEIYLIILLLTCRICNAQNLVPNGDFELYSGCPGNYSEIDSALYWMNPTEGTPDYYDSCASFASGVNVPNTGVGYQLAHSGGGYAGIILYHSNGGNIREYIEVPLLSPLVAGIQYYFHMFVNLSNNSLYTTDAIGAYFSDTAVVGIDSFLVLPFTAQVNNISGNLFNKQTWKKVSGSYTAIGGENYLILGNFKADSLTYFVLSGGGFAPVAYTFIEDVCVSIDSLNCSSTLGINEVKDEPDIFLFPNPISDKLIIDVKRNELVEVNLYDATSRKILQQKFTNTVSLNTEHLAKGIYLYEVRNKNG
ncbi:MAG: T9SS type A sorting domain-containing protein, partial [Bacteroidota bacterium]